MLLLMGWMGWMDHYEKGRASSQDPQPSSLVARYQERVVFLFNPEQKSQSRQNNIAHPPIHL
jgi:hypothetical protein